MRYIWLDILRGIAVLLVVFHHIIWPQIKPITTPYIFGNGGYMAVSLFFVLSGLVISLPYWQKKREFRSFFDVGDFFKRRFFRLYPLFILSALASLFFIFGFSPPAMKEAFWSLTTLGSFSASHFFPSINPVYWSLMLEVQMSLVFPIIIVFSRKIHIAWMLIIFVIIAYCVQLFWWKIPFENPHTSPYRDGIFGHLDEFVFGIFLAWLLVFRRIQLGKSYIFLGMGIAFLWIIFADLWRYGHFFSFAQNLDIHFIAARNIILWCAWFFLIFGSFSFQKAPKWFAHIGKMCFSVYVWHVFVAMIFEKYFWGIHGMVPTIWYFLVTALVSVVSFELVEKRFGNWLLKKFW